MGKKRVVIIGAGIAGLTLAYAFERSGQFDYKIVMSNDAEDIRHGRILSTQVHFDRFLHNETRFQIADYGAVNEIKRLELRINGQRMFEGNVHARAVSQDQRLYLSSLIDGLRARGADIQKTRLDSRDLVDLANECDLIVDCTGKRGPLASFPTYEELQHLPSSPQRILTGAMFEGIDSDDVHRMGFNIIPGQGEMFEIGTISKHGPACALLLEAVPGGELDCMKGNPEPDVFVKEFLDILRGYFPTIYERINLDAFHLVDPLSYLRLAIQPKVRIPYTTVNGTLVIGCGDSVTLNDPITGQGANAASYCAGALYEILSSRADQPWDTAVGEQYWNVTKEYITKMSEWTNAMMGPPSEGFSAWLEKASKSQEGADAFVNLFFNPIQAYHAYFSIPE
ncbi:styrene monooxygenase/indole monooxygenase family protein [Paenibacillus roseipurpureus]|uniref:Styrene monooxygenase n=1 Tax=Paenibacillus roseopurpureus TaxID=2918901 RepID=A0AA96LNL3_9BACL|nr:styrene monooxygenase/indole monooxygenase family protein [Paenibacillus sp. MBLB1832]WNR44427.1 styrene monooxygenase [Paenibacillus sp. MBLB1832]